MGLSRRRDASIIWPGFVDAVTTLVMVLMFVLTIFTVMQSVLQETITTQDSELTSLTDQVAALADALGLERGRVGELEAEVGALRSDLAASEAEGERQVQTFVAHHTDALLMPSPGHLLPQSGASDAVFPDNLLREHDGFYYALLEKRST